MIEDVSIGFLNIVIEAFLTGMPSRLASLRSALARGDAATVHEQARSLKSVGAFIGIRTFTGLCRELGALASTGVTQGATELLTEIEAEYLQIQQELQNWLDKGNHLA